MGKLIFARVSNSKCTQREILILLKACTIFLYAGIDWCSDNLFKWEMNDTDLLKVR